jgi:BirA family biotin operon repressor/biotin-[acetyl-CoA-carboxylase] ligase
MSAWRIRRHAVVDSTNELALGEAREALARGERADGLVIVAERQTAGRGQHGRTWESPPGGLYLSMVVQDVLPEMRERLALLAGAAAAAALERIGAPAVQLWWPNDIMLARGEDVRDIRKVGGVLCEAVAMGNGWAGVIGIGINIETATEYLPPAVRSRATSLAAQGVRATCRQVEAALLDALEERRRLPLETLVAQVAARDGLRGRRLVFQAGDHRIEGAAAGLSPRGDLLIHTSTPDAPARTHALSAGTIIAVEGIPLRP